MKKAVYFIFILLFLAGCENVTLTKKLKIIAPTGAPAVAFYNYLNDENFITNTQPNNIQASMVNHEYDVAVIDVVSGVKVINQGAPYLLAGVLTFGNYYILSLGNDDNEVIDNDDIIVSFGQNLTPDLVFKDLYPEIEVEYYVAGVSEVSAIAISSLIDNKTVNYVFIAQPVMQKVLQTNKNTFIYQDIQELFASKHGIEGIPQAGLFVRNNLDTNSVNKFLDDLKDDINNLLSDPAVLDNLDNDKFNQKIGIASALARTILANNNGINLGFKNAFSYKESINTYFNVLGLSPISDEIVYNRAG